MFMQKMSAVCSTQKELKTISVFVTNLAKLIMKIKK